MEKDLLEFLMELKSKFSKIEVSMDNIKNDISDLKKAFKEMVEIEKRQQRIEDNYKRLLDCCDDVNNMKVELQELKDKVERLERNEEKRNDRIWKVILSVTEKFIIWIVLGAIVIKEKLL